MNDAKIQDSLDNLSNTKLRQSSLQKHRLDIIHLKQKFVGLLQKLQSSQTRQISLTQLKRLIQQNPQPDHLRVYLSILRSLKPNHNPTTKQHEVLVISIIVQVFRANLVDSGDKQPTLIKTCFKIVQILHAFFNDGSSTVMQACARVLLDINEYCLKGNANIDQTISILFTPLISILKNGVDKASQATSTVCINELVKYWFKNQQREYLDIVSKEIFQVVLKLNSEYHDIFNTIIVMIDHKGLQFFQNKLPNFLSKVLTIINGTRQVANNFNSYMCRVNVCRIIQKIALLLKAEQRDKLVDLNILGSLQKAARNKIIQVQMAATRALKAWNGTPMPLPSNQRKSNSHGKPLRSLQDVRNEKKRQRSISKQHSIKMESQLNYLKEDLEKMVKGGWGANNRAKNYVKRGTGVGGGYYGEVQYSTPPKNAKSHKEHLQQLRQVIKKGSIQNKNIDKFQQPQQIYRSNQQIPTTTNNNVDDRIQQRSIKAQNKIVRKQSNPKLSNNQDDNQFTVVQQSGQQMISFKPKIINKKTSNATQKVDKGKHTPVDQFNDEQNLYIDSRQAQQLLRQQKQLIEQHKRSNKKIDFYSQAQNKSVQPHKTSGVLIAKKNNPYTSPQQQSLTLTLQPHAKVPLKPSQQIQVPTRSNQNSTRLSQSRQNMNKFATVISEQELQQLMMENNLSQVSQNFSGLLNQSDFHQAHQLNYQTNQQQSLIYQSKQVGQSKFMPKANQSIKLNQFKKMDDSLHYTQSKVSKYKQSFVPKQTPNKTIVSEPQQFTLNPNSKGANRFQSIIQPNQQQQQVQEDIVQSCFQQSRPRQQSFLPIQTKPTASKWKQYSAPQGSSNLANKKQVVQDPHITSQNYQQLIEHPPVQRHLDRRSEMPITNQSNSKVNQTQPQQQPQQSQSVTDAWLRIMQLVQNNQLNLAFQQAFQLDDPIYLIRLMIITNTPISALTAQNCSRLWQKFLDVYQHNFISIMFVQMFTQAQDLNLVKNSLTIQEIHQTLVQIYQISGSSKGKLSFNAAVLYNNIDGTLKPKKI